jgi:hypothetical protein
MNPRDRWSALGSRRLFFDYFDAAVQWNRHAFRFDENGRFIGYDSLPPLTAAQMQNGIDETPEDLRNAVFDEVSVSDLARLLDRARARGVRVAAYATPIYGPRYRTFQAANDAAYVRLRELIHPGETYLDFNDGSHRDIVENPANYVDHGHLTRDAALVVSREVASAIGDVTPLPAR